VFTDGVADGLMLQLHWERTFITSFLKASKNYIWLHGESPAIKRFLGRNEVIHTDIITK
jgi:hypothetical protein